MNRVTPDMVSEAVKKNDGIRLVFSTWYKTNGDDTCACALSHLMIAKGDDASDLPYTSEEEVYDTVSKSLGLSSSYVGLFAYGFDGGMSPDLFIGNRDLDMGDAMAGYEDGLECRKALDPDEA